MEQAWASPRPIVQPGAWKCKSVDLQMEHFERQNRTRLRRLEHTQDAMKRVEKKMQAVKPWDNEARRLENIRRRLERKKVMERQRKVSLEKSSKESKHEFLENHGKIRDEHEEEVRKCKEKMRKIRKKHGKRQQRLQTVRITEEEKQSDLRKRWAAKEQQFREQKGKITTIARELLAQAKHDHTIHINKERIDIGGRWKPVAKIERLYKNPQLREDTATNAAPKEHTRLQRINKQRFINPKEEAHVPDLDTKVSTVSRGQAIYMCSIKSPDVMGDDQTDFPFDHRKSKSACVVRRDRNNTNTLGSFPALAPLTKTHGRSDFIEVISPITTQNPHMWNESKVQTHKGSLPVVSMPVVSVPVVSRLPTCSDQHEGTLKHCERH